MLIKLYPDSPSQRHLHTIAECVMDGGLIIYPTDSVYAFACLPHKNQAVERLCQLKAVKKKEAQFAFAFADLSQLSNYAKINDKGIFRLLKNHLPGPFTFILNAANSAPKIFNSKRKTIGVRMPSNPVSQHILQALNIPLVSASVDAQDDYMDYNTDPELLYDSLGDRVDLVVDGGYGSADYTTVVDCSADYPEIIRQGLGILDI